MTEMKSPIIGQCVFFRQLTDEDAEGVWHNWMNDQDMVSLLGRCPEPISIKMQKDYLAAVNASNNRCIFGVCEIAEEKLIGIASLSDIDRYHKKAQTSLFIGDKNFRSLTFALETMSILTEVGLIHLELNRLDASALSLNSASHNLNKALGWSFVGVKRKSHFYNGNFVDSTLYEILRDDWLISSKRPILK